MRKFLILLTAWHLAQAPLLAQIPANIQPVSRVLWDGGNVTFTLGTSNAGPFAYRWQLDSTNLPNDIITTVAGNGMEGYSGDGGAATNANVYDPVSVAVDSAGNLFVAELQSNHIRKINTNGVITTVAGNGAAGYSGDGDTATNASLHAPMSVVVDVSGNLFIADYLNYVIRKVNTNGIISTVAGNGTESFLVDGGMATNAELDFPSGVAIDTSGDLFISELEGNRIRKVDTNGIITTMAGDGVAGYSGDGGAATNATLSGPTGVAVDASGSLYIADIGNYCIREVNTNGIISTVAGNGIEAYSGDGGAATNASLGDPYNIALDASGNLFISEIYSGHIREVGTNGIITTVAGNGGFDYSGDGSVATNSALADPDGLAVDASGNLFIADDFTQRIRKVTNTRGPTLALNDLTSANSGNYQVVATSSDGSVTSSVASLCVANTPFIYGNYHNSDGTIALNFVSQPGSTNILLCATNLTPPVVWQPLSTNMAGPDGNWQFTDINAVERPSQFYQFLSR